MVTGDRIATNLWELILKELFFLQTNALHDLKALAMQNMNKSSFVQVSLSILKKDGVLIPYLARPSHGGHRG